MYVRIFLDKWSFCFIIHLLIDQNIMAVGVTKQGKKHKMLSKFYQNNSFHGMLKDSSTLLFFQKSFDEQKTYQPTSKDSFLVMKYRKPENISSIIELRYLSWLHFSSQSWHLTKSRNDFQKISYKRISICANCQLQNFLGKRLQSIYI